MFHFMRLGLTTEGAETPVRAARKEACGRIRFAQLGRNSPTLNGRQMIYGRGVDEWHEVRLPPSSFRAPRSGFPRFQWLTDLSTAPPRIKCAPSPDRGIDNSALSAQMDLTLFVYTRWKIRRKLALARFPKILIHLQRKFRRGLFGSAKWVSWKSTQVDVFPDALAGDHRNSLTITALLLTDEDTLEARDGKTETTVDVFYGTRRRVPPPQGEEAGYG